MSGRKLGGSFRWVFLLLCCVRCVWGDDPKKEPLTWYVMAWPPAHLVSA